MESLLVRISVHDGFFGGIQCLYRNIISCFVGLSFKMIQTKKSKSKEAVIRWIGKMKKEFPFAVFKQWEKDGFFYGQMVN